MSSESLVHPNSAASRALDTSMFAIPIQRRLRNVVSVQEGLAKTMHNQYSLGIGRRCFRRAIGRTPLAIDPLKPASHLHPKVGSETICPNLAIDLQMPSIWAFWIFGGPAIGASAHDSLMARRPVLNQPASDRSLGWTCPRRKLPLRPSFWKLDMWYKTVSSAALKLLNWPEGTRTSPGLDFQGPKKNSWLRCSSLMMSWWSQCENSCRSWAGCTWVCCRKSLMSKISTEWDLQAMYSAGRSTQWQQHPFLPAPLFRFTQIWIGEERIRCITVGGRTRSISSRSLPITVSASWYNSPCSRSSV